MAAPGYTQALVGLGFTALEAEAYAFLLRESPATGYRVAQAISKPAANTYKALEALQRKGAVFVDDSGSRLCRAVPTAELLSQLEMRFQEQKEQAARELARIDRATADDRVYQLHTRTQVLERARAMLKRCSHVAIMDAFPSLVMELREAIDAADARGAEIVIKTYGPIPWRGPRVIVRPRGEEITSAFPGDVISLNVDGVQHLLAVLRPEGEEVHQAIWTQSAIVSYLLYNGLVNEASQAAAMVELEKDTTVRRLRAVFLGLRHLHPATSRGPAYRNLMKHLRSNVKGTGRLSQKKQK